jgi:hypothetical protein
VGNYTDMSDIEINKLVAKALGYKFQGTGWVDGLDGIYNYISKSESGHREVLPEYCKSPAYSWDIIVENRIDITFYSTDNHRWSRAQGPGGHEFTCFHDRPLRAAMTVFLMMQETQHD